MDISFDCAIDSIETRISKDKTRARIQLVAFINPSQLLDIDKQIDKMLAALRNGEISASARLALSMRLREPSDHHHTIVDVKGEAQNGL